LISQLTFKEKIKLKLESYQENMSLLNMNNQRLVELMTATHANQEGQEQDLKTSEINQIGCYLEEIQTINTVMVRGN